LREIKHFCILFLFILATVSGFAQRKQTDTVRNGKTIIIISADRYNFQQIDSVQFVSLVGHAVVQQEKTLFSADSIVLNQKLNTLEAVGNVHINDADSIHTYSQYLRYVGKEKKAYLNTNVKLTDGKATLTTNDLIYDVQLKNGDIFQWRQSCKRQNSIDKYGRILLRRYKGCLFQKESSACRSRI